jgi:hypothetical protein
MQTIKTSVVVVMLLAAIYGVYVALNDPGVEIPASLLQEMEGSLGPGMDLQPDFDDGPFQVPGAGPSVGRSSKDSNPKARANGPSDSVANPIYQIAPGTSAPPARLTGFPPLDQPASQASPTSLDRLDPTEGAATGPTGGDRTSSGASSTASLQNSSAGVLPSIAPPAGQPTGLGLSLPEAHGKEVATVRDLTTPKLDQPAPAARATAASTTGDLSQPSLAPDSLATSAVRSEPATGVEPGLPNSTTTRSFENAKRMALEQIQRGQLKEALATLSLFYRAPELTHPQQAQLMDSLDFLAGEVIYSRKHYLEKTPHVVIQGETMDSIARSYKVPADILSRINGITDPLHLLPDTRLKVLSGPFRAEVDLERSELTMFLGELYAGRFPVSFGKDMAIRPKSCVVVEKLRDRNYYGLGGTAIDGRDPSNPYGGVWIDLGEGLCLHGSPQNPSGGSDQMGCISLSPIDAADVFGMLDRGSKVEIISR